MPAAAEVDDVEVRRLRADERGLYRDLRLRALADAPRVFGSELADERGLPDAEWARLAARGAAGDEMTIVVAIWNGTPVGIAGGRWRDRERALANLWGMWVDPAFRGRHVGERLVLAVRDWAHDAGARFIRLGAVVGPDGPGGFYERLGFVPVGDEQPLRRDPAVRFWEMVRPA